MKKFLTILTLALVLALFVTGMLPAFAVQESAFEECDTYVVSDDTDYVTGPPMPAPEPPKPIAVPIPPVPVPPEEDHTPPGTTPRPEWYPMPDAVWRPMPEPIIIAVERVLPCPPEPIKDPSKGIQIEPNDDVGPGPDGNVRPIAPEPTPSPWEPEEPGDDIIVAALPPRENVERGCVTYCTLNVDTISITLDSVFDIDPRLLVFDMTTCRAEVKEPASPGHFEVERPRGTRLFLAVFDGEGVIFDVTVWTPPLP